MSRSHHIPTPTTNRGLAPGFTPDINPDITPDINPDIDPDMNPGLFMPLQQDDYLYHCALDPDAPITLARLHNALCELHGVLCGIQDVSAQILARADDAEAGYAYMIKAAANQARHDLCLLLPDGLQD